MDFSLVDVFGVADFSGNPVAVVHDAAGLDAVQMQRITRWLNLSETTFLLPPAHPEADYRVRIFTLDREMPFAGHPTLGTAHAWLEAGGTPRDLDRIVQECGAGLVPIRRAGGRLAFAAPPLIRSGPVDEGKLAQIAGVLGIARNRIVDAAWADNGPGWAAVLVGSAEEALSLEPARHHPSRMEIGVIGPYPPGHDAAYEVRAIFSDPFGGLLEDPVTGSLNASVAQWMLESGRVAAPYVAAQGTRLGRTGRVAVEQADGQVWIGGATKTLFRGSATF
ncbi:PhzF family phenazine biosynthesis isomerase [Sphingomonas sp. MAH-20]|uniref:PhzF family phenazine biosynthesis isomerase n=1 Tax=Sphingomonas horti TaxID=2682842 RepID=A0A6I4J4V1_9SPHN|nr:MULTISPECIES: PhzF family phenazine biosynthesis protein [Sphingomonas]MBA2919086.1 PhzF family phenazine biosynthesis protein [Sphingomonas sp. CGMCC 1.13658]MVO79118.1 PhzF family phenazine biosynthesis isomerase [Sphingomonas horti]